MTGPASTRLARAVGIEYPIFGFTHDRLVAAAVSRAGGIGVYGAAYYPPEQVEQDLEWIRKNCDGRPFGVDIMIPSTGPRSTDRDLSKMEADLRKQIPAGHAKFVERLLDRFAVPPLPAGAGVEPVFPLGPSESAARQHIEISVAAGAKVIVSALGPAPAECVEELKAAGIMVGGMVGLPKHTDHHIEAGADFIIAQGSEAAAHSGDVSTMVLVPQVVDRVAPIPVLAAGGISDGRQWLAARALGAEGIWSGSIWRTATECQEPAAVKKLLLAARSEDTVKSRCMTGKPLRQLRSQWNQAWAEVGSPDPLPMPMQRMLTSEAEQRITFFERYDLLVSPIGQTVGQLAEIRSVADIVLDYVEGYLRAAARLRDDATGAHP